MNLLSAIFLMGAVSIFIFQFSLENRTKDDDRRGSAEESVNLVKLDKVSDTLEDDDVVVEEKFCVTTTMIKGDDGVSEKRQQSSSSQHNEFKAKELGRTKYFTENQKTLLSFLMSLLLFFVVLTRPV